MSRTTQPFTRRSSNFDRWGVLLNAPLAAGVYILLNRAGVSVHVGASDNIRRALTALLPDVSLKRAGTVRFTFEVHPRGEQVRARRCAELQARLVRPAA